MLSNKKFARYGVAFCILGVLWMFFYSGLQNDQINIIQGFSGWDATQTQLPMTVGNFVCIALTYVYGTLFMKLGVRKTLIPCIIVCALGSLGIAAANGLSVYGGQGNYGLYFVSLFLIRCACMCFQMSGFQMAASWFIKYRGTVLGIVTLGSPLFSVMGTSVMTNFISQRLGGDYRPFYVGVAIILVVVAILSWTLLRDMPEEVGCYPDGSDTAPKSEEHVEEVNLTIGQVLSEKRAWVLLISFGIYQFIINACMASMVLWFRTLAIQYADKVAAGPMGPMFEGMGGLEGAGAMALFVGQASTYLAIGALLGIPFSFLFGVIDDRFGTPVASLILGIAEFLPIIGLMTQESSVAASGSCNIPMLILWGFGVACMTGGVPTMHPASISFAYGRRTYQSANRIIMAIQLIPCALAAYMMAAFIQSGNGQKAWILLIVLVIIGIIATIPMFKMEDANAADRIAGQKKA